MVAKSVTKHYSQQNTKTETGEALNRKTKTKHHTNQNNKTLNNTDTTLTHQAHQIQGLPLASLAKIQDGHVLGEFHRFIKPKVRSW